MLFQHHGQARLIAAVLTINRDAGMPRVYQALGPLDRKLVTDRGPSLKRNPDLGRRNAGITVIRLWSNENKVTSGRRRSRSGPTVELTYHKAAHKMAADRGPL